MIDIKKNNQVLDYVKFLSSILICLSHALPIFHTAFLNRLYGQWFFRFCIPMFFVSAGFYFSTMSLSRRKQMIKWVLQLYILSTILYSPFWCRGLGTIIKSILFGYHHLWYLNSLFLSLLICYFILQHLNDKKILIISILLLTCGVFFDEYHLFLNNPLINAIAGIQNIAGGGRCTLLFSLPLILLGCLIYRNKERIFSVHKRTYIILVSVSSLLALLEFLLINHFLPSSTIDVSFFSAGTGTLFFILSFYINDLFEENKLSRKFRKTADVLYIIHVWVIVFVSKILGLQFEAAALVIIVISVAASFILSRLIQYFNSKSRAIGVYKERQK